MGLDKEILIYLYLGEHQSTRKIGKFFNVSHTIIQQNLREFNIPIRTRSEAQEGRIVLNSTRLKMSLAKKGKLSPFKGIINRYSEETLNKMRLSVRKRFKISENCPNYKGGKPKCRICGKELSTYTAKICRDCINISENSPNWQNGISFEPYPIIFNEELKEDIRSRDNHTCQKCNIIQNLCDRKLDVHHIDYNKKNCKESNLISLCRECHNKTLTNRDYWYAFYKYIIENSFNRRSICHLKFLPIQD